MNQRLQYKIRYTEPDSIEVENNLNLIGARKDFLNRTPLSQFLRTKINKWTSSNGKTSACQNNQDNVTRYRMGKYFYRLHKEYWTNIHNIYETRIWASRKHSFQFKNGLEIQIEFLNYKTAQKEMFSILTHQRSTIEATLITLIFFVYKSKWSRAKKHDNFCLSVLE